jgi:CBS domain containing-hemolysin-like protein
MDIPLHSQLLVPSIIFCLALALRAIFSFLETSIMLLRIFKLKEMAQTVGKYHSLFKTLEKNPQPVLITILIANSISDVILASLATIISEIVFSYFILSGGIGF